MSNLLIIILLLILVDIKVSHNDKVFFDTAEIKSKIGKKLKEWLKS
jgi:hypothetical protein